MALDIDALKFERCEDEPIHTPESIQGYGYLFALNAESGTVEVISENVCDILRLGKEIVGRSFYELIGDEESRALVQETVERAKSKGTRLPVRIGFHEEACCPGSDCEFLAVIHASGPHFLVELEPATRFRQTYSAEHYIKLYALSVAPRFKQFTSLVMMAQEIVETIKYITNMERVVLYRFNDNNSGKVIAEAKNEDIESYLDLFYPASDIPAQARELYRVNWVRLTPNVDLDASPLFPQASDVGRDPLDLTHSLLRSMSPIHLQYIRNQGLQASFSISLVTHDRLWGLISCHSRQPTYLPQDIRLQCENLSQLFSWHLLAKEEEILKQKKDSTDLAINRMLEKVTPTNPIVKVFQESDGEILEAMQSHGFIYHSQQETIVLGDSPDFDTVKEIFRLANQEGSFPYINEQLQEQYPVGNLNGIAGIMVIPLAERKNYFTAWFRREKRQRQKWAGLPKEDDAESSKSQRLTPRASFQVNVREVVGRSLPFDKYDIDMASRLNRMFLVHSLDQQERLHSHLLELKQQDKNRNEFLATLAHELRNPLAPIEAGINVLESPVSEEVRRQVLTTLRRQSRYMAKLIDDLMDVARVTRGKIQMAKEVFALQEAMEQAAEVIDAGVKEREHRVTFDLPEEPMTIEGDRGRVSQVFANILQNAVKYTDPGGEIHISLQREGGEAVVRIRDNGLGIPAHKIDDVFTMFSQVKDHAAHTKGGLGIGLTLVSKLVKLHGGQVSVKSDGLGKGCEFTVRFPVVNTGSNGKPDLGFVPESSVKKILFVDDNEDILSLYSMLLTHAGFEVEVASNGNDAIQQYQQFQPQVVFLDIGLPDINGFDLCKILRSQPGANQRLFFSQSGWGSREDIAKAEQAGFDEHFIKPLTLEKILQALARH